MIKNQRKNPLVSEWIAKAEDDFQFAKVNLEEENGFFDQICFHFQQAAEKYLKAYIVAHDLTFKKTHELPTLLDICQTADSSLSQLREECDYLTEFYIEVRYPGLSESKTTKKHAEEAFVKAKRIRDFVRERLS